MRRHVDSILKFQPQDIWVIRFNLYAAVIEYTSVFKQITDLQIQLELLKCFVIDA